jgi:hypothetical protein
MKLAEIHDAWAKDAPLDQERLDWEATNIPTLHARYMRMLSDERMNRRVVKKEVDLLKRDKADWYSGSMAKEDLEERDWKPNPKVILRADVDKYVQADEDVVEANLRMGLCDEKVEVLTEILKSINNRSFAIGHAIADMRFKHGLN